MAGKATRAWIVEHAIDGEYYLDIEFDSIMDNSFVDVTKIFLSADNGATQYQPTSATIKTTTNSKYLRLSIDSALASTIAGLTNAQKQVLKIALTAGAFYDKDGLDSDAMLYTDNIRVHVINTTFFNMQNYETKSSIGDVTFYLPADIIMDFSNCRINGGYEINGYNDTTIIQNAVLKNSFEADENSETLVSDDFEGTFGTVQTGVNDNWTFTGTGTPSEENTDVYSGTKAQKITNAGIGDILEYNNNVSINNGESINIGAFLKFDKTNLVTNGDFENWTAGVPDNWSVVSGTPVQDNDSYSGSYSLANQSSTLLTLSQSVSLKENAKYKISFYAKDSGNLSNSTYYISLQYKDSVSDAIKEIIKVDSVQTTGDFVLFEIEIEPIFNADTLLININSSSASSYLSIDKLEIYEIPVIVINFGGTEYNLNISIDNIGFTKYNIKSTISADITAKPKFIFKYGFVNSIIIDDFFFRREAQKQNQELILKNSALEEVDIHFGINKQNVIFEFQNCAIDKINIKENAGGTKYVALNKVRGIRNVNDFFIDAAGISDIEARVISSYVNCKNFVQEVNCIVVYSNIIATTNIGANTSDILAYNSYFADVTNVVADNDNNSGLMGLTLDESQTGTDYISGNQLKIGRNYNPDNREAEIISGGVKGDYQAVGAFRATPIQNIEITNAVLEADQKTVTLTLAESLAAGEIYALVVNNVEDTAGNIIDKGTTKTFIAN